MSLILSWSGEVSNEENCSSSLEHTDSDSVSITMEELGSGSIATEDFGESMPAVDAQLMLRTYSREKIKE